MSAPKPSCGSCAAGASLFCATESAYFCGSCDSCAHGTTAGAGHGRQALCDLCEGSPAVVYCKNDAARLCATCDAQIHLSNPLAARHERVALHAFVFPETQPSLTGEAASRLSHSSSNVSLKEVAVPDSAQTATVQPPSSFEPIQNFKDFDAFDLEGTLFDVGMGFDMGGIDIDFFGTNQGPVTDGVVPNMAACPPTAKTALLSTTDSGSCCSSGPEGTTALAEDSTSPIARTTSSLSSGDAFKPASPCVSSPVAAMPPLPAADPDHATRWNLGFSVPQEVLHIGEAALTREHRVMRYRAKRARRSFQKTIRYQSRKAYAEIRPRIKGRFATKEEVIALKAEQALSSAPLLTVH